MSNDFVSMLEKRGYRVTSKKLGGGFVNDVKLIVLPL